MLLIYAFERVRDHKNSLLNNINVYLFIATNVYCLCLLNSYIQQVLINCLCLHNSYRPQMLTAYAYETVMDHKC